MAQTDLNFPKHLIASEYFDKPQMDLTAGRGLVPGSQFQPTIDNGFLKAGLGLIPGSPASSLGSNPSEIQLASGKLGWWDDIKDKLSGTALGAGLLIGAGGVGYLSATYIPKKYKTYGYVGALGLGVAGAYQIYKTFRDPTGEEEKKKKPEPTDRFPIVITDPTPGEEWMWIPIIPQTVNVQVNNPYFIEKKVYVGLSFIEDATGLVIDFPVKVKDIAPNSVKKIWWKNITSTIQNAGGSRGLYYVISAVWDVLPTPPCETQGTCNRLGEANSFVIFTRFG